MVLETTLENHLDSKEIKPVNPKGNYPEYSLEGPMLKLQNFDHLIGKDPYAGQDWQQEEKGMTKDETVGWHHRLNGHGFEQTPGDGEGQRSLACCSPWDCQELGMTG